MLMKKLRVSKLTSIAALVAVALGSTAYATQYTVTPLEMLGGTSTTVTGINSTGELVGYVTPSTGNDNAFLYNNGAMTDLNITGASNSYATAINSLGQIAVAEEPRAAGSARSHFLDVQCSTARIKVTRGTRHFARDALSSPLASTP